MTTPPHFRIEAEGYWVLARLLLGFLAAILAQMSWSNSGFILYSGIALVICVWLDGLTGWYFRRHRPKSPGTSALEIYADFICFVAAPLEFVAFLAMSNYPFIGLPVYFVLLPVFLLAAVYRLARFQVQGRVGKGYVGLPVTYNGYLFPLAALAIHFVPDGTNAILIILLVLTSALMVSSRFIVPEF